MTTQKEDKTMPKFYKYKNFDQFTNNIILNSSLYFSPIKNFNDPFDCRLSYRQEYTKEEIQKFHIQYLERNPGTFELNDLIIRYGKNQDFIDFQNHSNDKLIEQTGVLSLSRSPSSILMWSHYSMNHTGLVFEFTPLKHTTCFEAFYKVDYDTKYDLLSYTSDSKDEIPKLLLTKHKDWEYELEYRIIDLNFQGEKIFNKRELTSIIFGAHAKEDDMNRMINLCRSNGFKHVKFSKAELSYGEFSLKFKELIVNKIELTS